MSEHEDKLISSSQSESESESGGQMIWKPGWIVDEHLLPFEPDDDERDLDGDGGVRGKVMPKESVVPFCLL